MTRLLWIIYYGSFVALACEAAYAAYVGDWSMFWIILAAFAVAFLTYGPPSYVRRVGGGGKP